MLKMYLTAEVLRMIGVVYGTASFVHTVNNSPIYGHLLPQ